MNRSNIATPRARAGLPMRVARWLAGLTAALALTLATVTGCQVNPATGQQQFNVLSEAEEVRIGEQAVPEFLAQYGGELPSPEVVNHVRELGHKLARASERPDLPWEFHVVDSDVVNAFALPGGKVFVTRGMLEQLENEAQLAAVLGHEIGHVTAQHVGQQMSRQIGLEAGLAAIGLAVGQSESQWLQVLGVGAEVGGGLYLLQFSRQQELEADQLGMRYMTRVNYNPVGALQLLQILKRESQGEPLEFLSTHPLPQTRIDAVEGRIREDYPDYDRPQRYRFARDRYQTQMLQPLRELPPPAHRPQQAR
ncbi:MAG TPA: M48 family metallopeptidase [Phycisphaeraceae bacterium]